MSQAVLVPHFIDGQRGKLFVLLRRPRDRETGRAVLIVPPFAEEMNKTRRMFTAVAEDLAARGVATVLPDLYGTGDSEGEFRDADWEVWKDDLIRAAAWADEARWAVDSLLAVRLGCALAAEVAGALPAAVRRTVFWQPILDGDRFMKQFLRLRVAASMMEDRKETVAGLRQLLTSGRTLEVAGYELSGSLVSQVDSVLLADSLSKDLGALHWMEVVRSKDANLSTPSRETIEAARPALDGAKVHKVVGEPFWSATEIVRTPALVSETVAELAVST